MGVIFQLFSANDLAKLDKRQLQELKETVVMALSSRTVLATVKDRAYEVFDTLASGRVTRDLSANSPSQAGMLVHLFEDSDLAKLDDNQCQILEWAIICEILHDENALLVIREETDTLFARQKPGEPLPNGDTRYTHVITPRP